MADRNGSTNTALVAIIVLVIIIIIALLYYFSGWGDRRNGLVEKPNSIIEAPTTPSTPDTTTH